jgi:hypothetical protein
MSRRHQPMSMHPIYERVLPPSAAGKSLTRGCSAYVLSLLYAVFGFWCALYKIEIIQLVTERRKSKNMRWEKKTPDQNFFQAGPRFGPVAIMVALQTICEYTRKWVFHARRAKLFHNGSYCCILKGFLREIVLITYICEFYSALFPIDVGIVESKPVMF